MVYGHSFLLHPKSPRNGSETELKIQINLCFIFDWHSFLSGNTNVGLEFCLHTVLHNGSIIYAPWNKMKQ